MTAIVRSGAVLEGVDNAGCFAAQLLESLWWIRRCAIAIANDTDFTWSSPKYHLREGKLVNMPMRIPPGYTGVIGVNKTAAWPSGTSGILSYKSDALISGEAKYLQVGWNVPYSGSNGTVVRLGDETASEDLYSRFRDCNGFTSAADTSYNEVLVSEKLQADVFMGVDGHAVLVVLLKK